MLTAFIISFTGNFVKFFRHVLAFARRGCYNSGIEQKREGKKVIPLLYIGVVLGQTAQSSLIKMNNKVQSAGVIRFNFFKALAPTLLFFVLLLIKGESFHLPTMLYGMFFGVCAVGSAFFGYCALETGPLSLAYVLFNCCIIVPCLYGIIFQSNTVSLLNGVGFLLMAGAMVLLNFDFSSRKKTKLENGEKKIRTPPKWVFFAVLAMLCDGFCQVSQTAHQGVFPKEYQISFMFWGMLMWCVIYLAVALCTGRLKPNRTYFRSDLYATGSGVSIALANYFVLMLAAMSSATLLFPTISVCSMLGALAAGFLLFREKLKLQQWVGFLLGVGAVFLLQL